MASAPAAKPRHNPGIALLTFVALVVGLFFLAVVRDNLGLDVRPAAFGATFSSKYATFLGLDWKKTYVASLDELGLRQFRIPAYWDALEPTRGTYDFSDLDFQVKEADKLGAHILMAVGRKLPRWPECHAPAWTAGMAEKDVQPLILAQVAAVVHRYAKDPGISAWQVENEPFFAFGICPPLDREFLEKEVALVKSLDKRPVVITESGELSTWIGATTLADVVGISTYRSVWNKYVGYFYWPIGPSFYKARYDAIAPLTNGIIVTELQAEPWVTTSLTDMPLSDQRALMNPDRLKQNIDFAERIGFPEVYLWGIEWWYWLKEKGSPEMWNAGRAVIQGARNVKGLGI
ncbi:MAG: hypothetical protein RLZZ324_8 [Candidatus Parcubacteria bacterium]|jgi:hypothetical protein